LGSGGGWTRREDANVHKFIDKIAKGGRDFWTEDEKIHVEKGAVLPT
jgi:hypothetical protein